MRDSSHRAGAKESAHADFSHGLQADRAKRGDQQGTLSNAYSFVMARKDLPV
jgi:hypothetical protein